LPPAADAIRQLPLFDYFAAAIDYAAIDTPLPLMLHDDAIAAITIDDY